MPEIDQRPVVERVLGDLGVVDEPLRGGQRDARSAELGIDMRWKGEGVDEKGFDQLGNCIVAVDPRYFRPTEVESLLGDAGKARSKLGWNPRTPFKQLVAGMVRDDLKAAERDELVKKHGYSAYDYHE